MRDLREEPAEVVADERSRVAFEGWGARLLALQDDGQWDGGTYVPAWAAMRDTYVPAWTSTTFTLLLLRDLPSSPSRPGGITTC